MKFTKTFDVHYYSRRPSEGRKWSHKYTEEWSTDGTIFCPHCGKNEVWVEQGMGDYYVGNQHICAVCGWEFHMPGLNAIHERDESDTQRLNHIRGLPVTSKGVSMPIEFVDLDTSPEAREAAEKLWASKTREEVIKYCSVKMMPLKSQLEYWQRCQGKWPEFAPKSTGDT